LLRAPGLEAAVDRQSRLVSCSAGRVDYDERDNVRLFDRGDVVTWYDYDALSQLVRARRSDGRVFEAEYDALGRRTTTRWNGEERRFYWDADRLAAEIGPDGALRLYVYPDVVSMVPLLFVDYDSETAEPASGTTYHVVSDHRGCPVMVQDARGRVVWQAVIEPYGAARVVVGATFRQPLRFPGHYFDVELGLQTNRFRTYWPELGRYMQPNPIGLAGGVNPYSYGANPLSTVNVLGLRASGLRGVWSAGRLPELRPIADEVTTEAFVDDIDPRRPLPRGLGELHEHQTAALSALEDCRQLLHRDRELSSRFGEELFALERDWNLITHASEELSSVSLAGRDFETLLGDVEALRSRIAKAGPVADEPPTQVFPKGSVPFDR
jgi:RHS repeat-associated protein